MKRVYEEVVKEHFKENRQMVFLLGPRQVGKTTIGLFYKKSNNHYFNWDNEDHRMIIMQGPKKIAESIGILEAKKEIQIIIFDEIHKYKKWKDFLKGFFDTYGHKIKILVTGSAKLNTFKKGGDSLMGRYFPYRVHPLSVGEILDFSLRKEEVKKYPSEIDNEVLEDLLTYGGFPEHFLKKNKRFYQKWKILRKQQIFYEDLRDLTKVLEVKQLEILAEILCSQAANLVNYSKLANKVRVSVNTILRWIEILKNLYYCFFIKPWTKNITRSLLKEPKIYLWDWSLVEDLGFRSENFVASHLLKSVQFWTDYGFGEYDLFFIRDKEKREVDFLVTKNKKPWFLVEVKSGDKNISKSLIHFKNLIEVEHAFQVDFSKDFVDVDCFSIKEPVIVPAKTFLSQLV
jgi:predicted AAA+ superfamily ATPase